MNNFLDATGALLDIIIGILIFPLLLFVYCLIWSVIVFRFIKTFSQSLRKVRAKNKKTIYQFPAGIDLTFER